MLGGWSVGSGRPRTLAWRAGAGAGIGFAALVGIAAWAATISVEGVEVLPSIRSPGTAFATTSVGPELLPVTLVALIWGVAGGTVGALLAPRDRPDYEVVEAEA
jgi:hypothetical protein